VTEIADKLARWRPGAAEEVINLSLLPISDDDAGFLDAHLGIGPVAILSRGYGNCRITSTATRNAWWVRYYNSREILILNTLEITDIPSAACAAPQDLEDSAERLAEILEIYR
jgi:hydrogenase-1 operon protein HyaF